MGLIDRIHDGEQRNRRDGQRGYGLRRNSDWLREERERERQYRKTHAGSERGKALRIYQRRGAKAASEVTGYHVRTIQQWAKEKGVMSSRKVRRSEKLQQANKARAALKKARSRRRTRTASLQPGLIDRETLLERGVPKWIVDKRDADLGDFSYLLDV